MATTGNWLGTYEGGWFGSFESDPNALRGIARGASFLFGELTDAAVEVVVSHRRKRKYWVEEGDQILVFDTLGESEAYVLARREPEVVEKPKRKKKITLVKPKEAPKPVITLPKVEIVKPHLTLVDNRIDRYIHAYLERIRRDEEDLEFILLAA